MTGCTSSNQEYGKEHRNVAKPMASMMLALALLLPAASQAQTHIGCTGKVQNVIVQLWSAVFMKASWRNDFQMLCALNATHKEVSPDACRGWLATTQAAMLSGKTITMRMHTTGTCSDYPVGWNGLVPEYIMLNDQ